MFSSALSVGKPSALRVNVLFIGQKGSGKSTLLRSFALSYGQDIKWLATDCSMDEVHIKEVCAFYHTANTGDCEFHFYDCLAFGDLINNQASVDYIERYLIDAHNDWLRINAKNIPEQSRNLADKRIHLAISVNAPAAPHKLMTECWRKLHGLTSIVPVITKADTLTPDELSKLREDYCRVIKELSQRVGTGVMFSFVDDDRPTADLSPQSLNGATGSNFNEVKDADNMEEMRSDSTDRHFHDGCIQVLTSSLTAYTEANEIAQSAVLVLSQVSQAPQSPTVGDYPVSMEEIAYPSGFVIESTISTEYSSPGTDQAEEDALTSLSSRSTPAGADIFAVVCTLQQTHKRVYAWAAVDCFDETVSDFRKLLRLIFESGKLSVLRTRCQEMSMRLLNSRSENKAVAAERGEVRDRTKWKSSICQFFVLSFLTGTGAYLLKVIDWSSVGLWIVIGTGLAALIDFIDLLSARLELPKEHSTVFGMC